VICGATVLRTPLLPDAVDLKRNDAKGQVIVIDRARTRRDQCMAGGQAAQTRFPEDEHSSNHRLHPAQEVGKLIDKSRREMGHDPISGEARYRHVQGIDDIA
jgi:hypothetical protein